MSKIIRPIMLNNLLDHCKKNPSFLDEIPEFSFVGPIASTMVKRGCDYCGMGSTLLQAGKDFNSAATTLSNESVTKLKILFETHEICFVIQTFNSCELKCY